MGRVTLQGKFSNEVRAESFDFSGAIGAGDGITTVIVLCPVFTGVSTTPLTAIDVGFTGRVATCKLSGGTSGVVYDVLCTVTTVSGQTLNLSGYYYIKVLS